MTDLIARPYRDNDDYWRMRDFLRRVFLLNDRREQSWPVARLDWWRWHLVANCQFCGPLEEVVTIWEEPGGEIGAILHPIVPGELRLHVHPHRRSPELEDEMLATGEERLARVDGDGQRTVYLGVDEEDMLRQEALTGRGYTRRDFTSHKWYRDLGTPLPNAPIAPGYAVRSMGDTDEHPARSWASWRAFHADEPDEDYDGDWSWIGTIQSAPLYRRDLDLVAVAPGGEIASFCTIYYDDATRAAVCVLVGTAVEHQRRGLGKAVMVAGLGRLHRMGCTRVFATAYDPPAEALYRSVMEQHVVCRTWLKRTPAP